MSKRSIDWEMVALRVRLWGSIAEAVVAVAVLLIVIVVLRRVDITISVLP